MKLSMSHPPAVPAPSSSIFRRIFSSPRASIRRRKLHRAQVTVQFSTAMPRLFPEAVRLLANARKPVIYSGGGVINSGPAALVCCVSWSRPANFPITHADGAWRSSRLRQELARYAGHARHL
ncbi:hypothetical protein VXQ18_05160 [Brucella abortus]|nr:hypothetical protein [Brucella abortus]